MRAVTAPGSIMAPIWRLARRRDSPAAVDGGLAFDPATAVTDADIQT
jgi:hypothetical protein